MKDPMKDPIFIDPIVEELHRIRAERSARFNHDIHAMVKDLQRQEILSILENRNAFTELLDNAFSEINVIFGAENEDKGNTFTVSNSGLIAGSYQKRGQKAGSFGVIGPMRLDYKKLIPYIEYFAVEVTKILSAEEEEEEDS